MLRRSSAVVSLCLLLSAPLPAGVAIAQNSQSYLLNEVSTIGTSSVGVPVEVNFTSTSAGTYTITLTDIGAMLTPTPAPLASVALAVTQGSTVVGTPLAVAGTLTVTLAASTAYTVRIVGTPGSAGSGPIGLTVTDPTGAVLSNPAGLVIAYPPSARPATEAVTNGSFTVPAAGNYQITLTDFAKPAALSTVELILIQAGGASPYATLSGPGSVTTSSPLQTGTTYNLYAVGQGSAGVYSVVVTPAAGGAAVFSQTVPVGGVVALGTVTGSDAVTTLALADLRFPTPLASVGALVVRGGTLVASINLVGVTAVASAVPATAGLDYQVFGYATAAASNAGSYTVDLEPASGASLLHVTQAVADPSTNVQTFVYSTAVTSAATYSVDFTDFGFPAALSQPSLAVAQAGAVVGSPIAPGADLSAALVAGPLDVVVVATPAAGGGLFGIDVVAPSGTALFETSQGVGAAFSSTSVAVTTAGNYLVDVADLSFPAAFSELAVVVTQGGHNIGSIIGGGQFSFSATPGTYLLNFIATPNTTAQAGTFALSVAQAPPAPTVNLSSSAESVASGSTVTLTWSTTNATSCTASGGWSGALATSGTETSAAVTASTTFTLTCTGEGGMTAQSVTVALAPSSHGGGALDLETLLALFGVLALLRRGGPTARSAARGVTARS